MSKVSMSIAEAVEITSIGRSTLYLAIKEKKLVARKVGRKTIIMREDLDSFLASLERAA
jgi:excisionase family DNA binding protein